MENEINVKEYQIYETTKDELITTIKADGSRIYTVELPYEVENVYVVVVDKSGYEQVFYSDNDKNSTFTYQLIEGWNLIAMVSDNTDLAPLKKVIQGNLWSWNGTEYEIASSPKATEAIWVYSPKATDGTVEVTKSEKQIRLHQGWNMVGPTSNTSSPLDADIIYSWEEKYQTILQDDILIQGVGYWIFTF